MSNTYINFKSIYEEGLKGCDMSVTAFVGGEHGHCIQLTTKNDFVCLAENQIKDLIDALQARLDMKITATGWEDLPESIPKTTPGGRQ